MMMKELEPQQNSEEPELIYHYTDQKGFLGILDTKSIWATHVRYLNDLQEIKSGEDAFRRVLDEAVVSSQHESKEDQRVETILAAIKVCDMYVASFSAANKGDSLSLWRAYSSNGVGFSLGFPLEQLREIVEIPSLSKEIPDGRWLSKVSYSAQNKPPGSWSSEMQGLRKAFRIVAESIQNKSCNQETLNVIAMMLVHFLPSIKDQGFIDEVEYRIVHVTSPKNVTKYANTVEFHPGSFSLIPHVPIPLRPSKESHIALSRVVVGPSSHPDEAVRAVQMLLASKGIQVKNDDFPEGVEVVPSQIPYRNW
jgi:hypothetical protein